jgi:hypothetical protein
VIPHGPHAITWTHAAQVNQALLGFLRDQRQGSALDLTPCPLRGGRSREVATGRESGRGRRRIGPLTISVGCPSPLADR